MKLIFEEAVREELIGRIDALHNASLANWGKMNVHQMVAHCIYWDAWILGAGDFEYRQEFMGKIFGKMALRRMIKNEKALDRNIPTSAQFKVDQAQGELSDNKVRWQSLLRDYAHYENPGFIHDFFGRMTAEQIGILAYKHSDHHLRQFGA